MLKTVGFPSTRTGDQTIVDGNLVIATSGKGIDFSATSGTGTSELFSDYEEGAWTTTVTGAVGTITTASFTGTYTKIGRIVVLEGSATITTNGTGSAAVLLSLPFTAASTQAVGCGSENLSVGYDLTIYLADSNTLALRKYDWSYPGADNIRLSVQVTYRV